MARLAREAVGDGEDLVRFFTAVLRADRKALGERRIALRDRMQAGMWLADRAFGRAVQVVEAPEDPAAEKVQEVRQEIAQMPAELREAIGRWLLDRRNARLRAQREEIEAKVKTLMPAEPDPNTSTIGGHPPNMLPRTQTHVPAAATRPLGTRPQ